MSLQVCLTSFIQVGGTGTQTVPNILDQNGAAFVAKGFLFYGTGQVTNSGLVNYRLGFDDGVTHLGKSVNGGDFLGAYDASETAASDAYSLVTTRSAAFNNINSLGYVQSIASGSFVVKWDQNSSDWSAGQVWNVLAIGGSGVSAAVVPFPIPATPQSTSLTGLAFEPTVLLTSYHPFATGTFSEPGCPGTISIGVAAACDLGQWGTSAAIAGTANPSETSTYQQQTAAFSAATNAAVILKGVVTAFTSDGCTANWITVPGGSGLYAACLALGGVAANVGSFDQLIATGATSFAVDAAQPHAILVASANKAASASITSDALFSLGVGTAAAQRSIWTGDMNGKAPPTWNFWLLDPDELVQTSVAIGLGGASGTARATLTALLQNAVGLDWTVVDSTMRETLYCILADDLGGGVCGAGTTPTSTMRVMRLLRRFELAYERNLWIFLSRLELIVQSGVGLSTGQGSDPQILLRLSRDAGHTWGPELSLGLGAIGQYQWRAYVNRLGRGRQWVAEVVVTDPVLVGLLDCLIDAEVGTS